MTETDIPARAARPPRGLGLGINASDFHTSYLTSATVDYLEVTAPSSRLRGSPSYRDASKAPHGPGFERRGIRELHDSIPVLVHSTNVNPTYPTSCTPEDLRELRELVKLTGTPWVTEDLGVWLMNERHVYPFFMPLVCTEEVLAVTIANVRKVQDILGVPFNAEFPPMVAIVGDIHPFDFFSELTSASGCNMAIDLGHVLSFQLLRDASPMADSHRLPWSAITEVHIAGGGIDLAAHGFSYEDDHGDEEIVTVCFDMLDEVVAHAPGLQAITLELFGARSPMFALSRLDAIRARPTVSAWLTGATHQRIDPRQATEHDADRAMRQHIGLYDLLHTNEPISGNALAEAGSDVLGLFAAAEQRRWDSVRRGRLQLVGGTLADYFPMTLTALVSQSVTTADAVAESVLAGTTGEEGDYWPAVVDTFSALIEPSSTPDYIKETFRCELWMNECVRSGHPSTAEFAVDARTTVPTGLLASTLVIEWTGTRFQFSRSVARDAVHACSTAGVKGRAPCCTGI